MPKYIVIKDFCRREAKFILSKPQYDLLTEKIRDKMCPDIYCIDGEKYTVRNVYYDTENNGILYRCSNKPDYKEKVRIRSYYPVKNDSDEVFLEIKKKINGVVVKRRVTLPYCDAVNFLEKGIKPNVNDFSSKQTVLEIENFLKKYPVKPYSFIKYERLAFFDKNNPHIRLTVDNDIKIRTENPDIKNENATQYLIDKDKFIAEIKFDNAIPLYLAEILSECNVSMQGFSKCGTIYEQKILEKKNNISEGALT